MSSPVLVLVELAIGQAFNSPNRRRTWLQTLRIASSLPVSSRLTAARMVACFVANASSYDDELRESLRQNSHDIKFLYVADSELFLQSTGELFEQICICGKSAQFVNDFRDENDYLEVWLDVTVQAKQCPTPARAPPSPQAKRMFACAFKTSAFPTTTQRA